MALGRPGVYVQETLTPLTTAATNTGVATAAFVGTATYGPTVPQLVSSWSQYSASYNAFGTGTDLLPYAVYQFFANGGSQCWIVRAAPSDAAAGTVTLMDIQGTPANLLTITQKSPGTYGNATYITVVAGATAGYFDMTVAVGATTNITDRYVGVTLNPADPQYLIPLIDGPNGSNTITASYVSSVSPWTSSQTPAAQSNTPLTGGAAGTANLTNLVTSTELLATVPGILNINLPGVSAAATINPLLTWAAAQNNAFLVVDAPQGTGTESTTVTAYLALAPTAASGTPWSSSSYGAAYGPWLIIGDPSSLAANATKAVPPGGSVLGQYMSSDAISGPYQTPAGTNTPLLNVVSVDTVFTPADLDSLNTAGVNVIRTIPQYGYCIVGGRTLAYGMPSRYISIRRTLMFVEDLLRRSVQFALFQPNNQILWGRISSILNQNLGALMQSGYFATTNASTAYWVVCDASNNASSTVAVGQVNVSVGVALAFPAEYVIINIGLFDSTTAVSNTLP